MEAIDIFLAQPNNILKGIGHINHFDLMRRILKGVSDNLKKSLKPILQHKKHRVRFHQWLHILVGVMHILRRL